MWTALLAFRIWWTNKRVANLRYGRSLMTPAFRIVIDAGLLYSATLLSVMLCFVTANNGQYVALDLVCLGLSLCNTHNHHRIDHAHHFNYLLYDHYSSRHDAQTSLDAQHYFTKHNSASRSSNEDYAGPVHRTVWEYRWQRASILWWRSLRCWIDS